MSSLTPAVNASPVTISRTPELSMATKLRSVRTNAYHRRNLGQ